MSRARWLLLPAVAAVLVLLGHRPQPTPAPGEWDPAPAVPAAPALRAVPFAAVDHAAATRGAPGLPGDTPGQGLAPWTAIAAPTAAPTAVAPAPRAALASAMALPARAAPAATVAGARWSPLAAAAAVLGAAPPLPGSDADPAGASTPAADAAVSGGLPLNGGFTAGGIWVRAPIGHMPTIPRPISGNG